MSRRRSRRSSTVPADVIQATLGSAEQLGRDVADVPIAVIAHALGVSRSTLLRQLGGSRRALDDAVRETGVDPGGRPPVRLRALDAAAALISAEGVAAATFEAIAARADCSVHSLYAVFAGRDELLQAVYDRYLPNLDVADVISGSSTDLTGAVRRIYRWLADAHLREPRVMSALVADALARPAGWSKQILVEHGALGTLAVLRRWLDGEVAAGRLRDVPRALLVQQLIGPIVMHCMMRQGSAADDSHVALPALDECCDVFADAFVSAATP